MKLVHVKWIDTCGGDSGWCVIEDQDTDAMDTVITCESVGSMTIPRPAIIKITEMSIF